jgi:hypothetical protein
MFPLFVPKNQNFKINIYIYLSKLLLYFEKQVGFDKHSLIVLIFQYDNGKA